MTLLKRLSDALGVRSAEWGFDSCPTLSFRGCELAGEVGEACNEIKKLERESLGACGGKADTSDLADELGDVIICCMLVARGANIDLDEAVVRSSTRHPTNTDSTQDYETPKY